VEAEPDFNDLCLIPNTGMFFVANEDKKILSYYVPVSTLSTVGINFLLLLLRLN